MQNRFLMLDGLRGFAALLVLNFHLHGMFGFKVPHAYFAVDLFFVLSGFVLASAYTEKLASGQLLFLNFLLIRLVRLWPTYGLALAISICYVALKPTVTYNELAQSAILELAFLPSAFPNNPDLFPLNFPTWSLFYELITNTSLALLAILGILTLGVARLIVLASAVGLALILGVGGAMNGGSQWGASSMLTGFLRANFGLFLGTLLFRTHQSARPSSSDYRCWVGAALATAPLLIPEMGKTNELILDAVALTFLIPVGVYLATGPIKAQRQISRIIELLGLSSYGVYVFHIPLSKFWFQIAPHLGPIGHPGMSGIIFSMIVFLLSIYFVKLIDLPFRKMTSRFIAR